MATADELLERLRIRAQAKGGDVTIHTNPDVSEDGIPRPEGVGLICVHPLSDPGDEYSANTLTEALEQAAVGALLQDGLADIPIPPRFDRGPRDPEGGGW
jgi:hypothetical protein